MLDNQEDVQQLLNDLQLETIELKKELVRLRSIVKVVAEECKNRFDLGVATENHILMVHFEPMIKFIDVASQESRKHYKEDWLHGDVTSFDKKEVNE